MKKKDNITFEVEEIAFKDLDKKTQKLLKQISKELDGWLPPKSVEIHIPHKKNKKTKWIRTKV